jgi:hypothetical protein|tara:strand:- start:3613 stop:3756 length:144 start_codon:yes stop_codon:yes gene_type:complete
MIGCKSTTNYAWKTTWTNSPQSVEAESVKSIIRGEFGGSAGDVSLKF